MKFDRKLDAVQHWVRGFNAIPQSFITGAIEKDGGYFFDTVELLASPEVMCGQCSNQYNLADLPEDGICECGAHDWSPVYEIPMWGTMWTFESMLDEEWTRDNPDTLAECGFHVFDHNELGVFIGIDGAGYDFYEAHWVPLYDARGLKWHKEDEEVE